MGDAHGDVGRWLAGEADLRRTAPSGQHLDGPTSEGAAPSAELP